MSLEQVRWAKGRNASEARIHWMLYAIEHDVPALCRTVEELAKALREVARRGVEVQDGFWGCRHCCGEYAFNPETIKHTSTCAWALAKALLAQLDRKEARKEASHDAG